MLQHVEAYREDIRLLRDDEVNDLCLDSNPEWSDRRVHKSSVDANAGLLRLFDIHLACAIWVDVAMVEDFSTIEQIEPFK